MEVRFRDSKNLCRLETIGALDRKMNSSITILAPLWACVSDLPKGSISHLF